MFSKRHCHLRQHNQQSKNQPNPVNFKFEEGKHEQIIRFNDQSQAGLELAKPGRSHHDGPGQEKSKLRLSCSAMTPTTPRRPPNSSKAPWKAP